MTSIVATLLSWFCLAILALSALMDIDAVSFSPDWMPFIALLALAGTSLAFVAAWIKSVVA
jgi:hypothetical protein